MMNRLIVLLLALCSISVPAFAMRDTSSTDPAAAFHLLPARASAVVSPVLKGAVTPTCNQDWCELKIQFLNCVRKGLAASAYACSFNGDQRQERKLTGAPAKSLYNAMLVADTSESCALDEDDDEDDDSAADKDECHVGPIQVVACKESEGKLPVCGSNTKNDISFMTQMQSGDLAEKTRVQHLPVCAKDGALPFNEDEVRWEIWLESDRDEVSAQRPVAFTRITLWTLGPHQFRMLANDNTGFYLHPLTITKLGPGAAKGAWSITGPDKYWRGASSEDIRHTLESTNAVYRIMGNGKLIYTMTAAWSQSTGADGQFGGTVPPGVIAKIMDGGVERLAIEARSLEGEVYSRYTLPVSKLREAMQEAERAIPIAEASYAGRACRLFDQN
jgi:hypothetical protein